MVLSYSDTYGMDYADEEDYGREDYISLDEYGDD
jgi:hypothetical protein